MEVDAPVIEDVYPLSPPQLTLFQSVQPNSLDRLIHQLVFRVQSMDAAIAERTWQRLIEHHAALRTSIQWEGLEHPVQVVQGDLKFSVERHDWRSILASDYRKELAAFLAEDRRRGIAPDYPFLFRVSLVELSDENSLLVWSFHRLILDAWSADLVLADFSLLFEAAVQDKFLLLMPAPRYRDYVSGIRSQDTQQAEDFWRRLLSDLTNTTPTPLPLGQHANDDGFQEARLALGSELTQKLRRFAARQQVKVATLIRAAWSIVLGCHSGCDEVVFGEVGSGRPTGVAPLQRTVGVFANTAPLRVKIPARDKVWSWLRDVEKLEVQQRPFQHHQVPEILAWGSLPPDQPLFESVLHLEKKPPTAGAGEMRKKPAILTLKAVESAAGRPDYPLVITVATTASKELILKAATLNCRFQPGIGAHLLTDLRTVLARLAMRPQLRLEDLYRSVSPLIPIQNQGSQAPLFFVHPAGGSVTAYFPLANALGSDQPFFAFEARGSEKRHHIRTEALASYYLSALRRAFPNGPYRIAGWSLGALIAYEMARQLQLQGHDVSEVIMLDPPQRFKEKKTSGKAKKSSPLLRFARTHGLSIKQSALERVPERRTIAFLLKRFKKAQLLPAQTTIAQFRRQVQLFLYHGEAHDTFEPQSYPGRVLLFAAEEGKDRGSAFSGGDWAALITRLEVHRVPGSHQTMLRHPNLPKLVEKLRSAIGS